MTPPPPPVNPAPQSLEHENARLRAELERLRARLAAAESGSAPPPPPTTRDATTTPSAAPLVRLKPALTPSQCERYARHLVLPAFGAAAQARVCARSALVVGCGGLGCPAALYLAAAGVGRLGLADRDSVELSNLHRQVAHAESRVGERKAASAARAVRALNSGVRVDVIDGGGEEEEGGDGQHGGGGLTARNAVALVRQYDVVLDCTDNAPARYLLSDACAAAGRPLVSAAAVGTDGQLTVYCRRSVAEPEDEEDAAADDDDTPCYRCLFPEPPVAENCARCAEAGVLGPVPGVMGVLQALEALKLLAGGRGGMAVEEGGGASGSSGNDDDDATTKPAVIGELLARRMLLYDALAARFTTVKLRGRRDDCVACGGRGGGGGGEAAAAARGNSAGGQLRAPGAVAATDYEAFTGQSANDALPPALRVIPDDERLTAVQLAERLRSADAETPAAGGPPPPPRLVLLDVRPRAQFDVMALRGAVNVPYSELDRRWGEVEALVGAGGEGGEGGASSVVVVCRRGNHSQLCARRLRAALVAAGVATEAEARARVRDVIGGYEAWAASCEPHVPVL